MANGKSQCNNNDSPKKERGRGRVRGREVREQSCCLPFDKHKIYRHTLQFHGGSHTYDRRI